jgi:pimeloyl-ACP methyl ester carboxylesterase
MVGERSRGEQMQEHQAGVGAAAGEARSQVLRLADGRRLAFAEWGDPAGLPLIAFHGTPGSRLMFQIADAPARRQGVRLITPDRPGFGLSDLLPGRRIGDWAKDVAALADALGLERIAVAGISGGGPYALACAARLPPERLLRVGVVSGLGPVGGRRRIAGLSRRVRFLFTLGRRAPWAVRRLAAWAQRRLERAPEATFARIVALSPPQDQAIMTRPEVKAVLLAGIRDAFCGGAEGVAQELVLFASAWDFALEPITAEVLLWHGEDDHLVPPAMGRHLAATIPECRATFLPGAGHYFVFDQIETLLGALVASPAEPSTTGA